jgi:hypothetical protein
MTDFAALRRKLFPAQKDGRFRYHNRTICCLYRTEILQNEKLSFLPDSRRGLTVGQKLYFDLLDKGYRTVELPPAVMAEYIVHLSHATQVVNPREFRVRHRDTHKLTDNVDKLLASPIIREIAGDDSLDG